MQNIRIDNGLTFDQNIKRYLDVNDKVLHTFEVIPLDYRVSDYTSPKMLITLRKVIFTFDEVLEIYDLSNLEIGIVGSNPSFDMWRVITEPTFVYSYDNTVQLEKAKLNEYLTRLSINEVGAVPKYFLLRKVLQSQKSIKTWALSQLLKNIKMGKIENREIMDMLNGYMSSFNLKTIIVFLLSFIIYILLKVLGSSLPSIVLTIFDIVFGIIVVFIGYWTYISVNKNLMRYKNIFLSYSSKN